MLRGKALGSTCWVVPAFVSSKSIPPKPQELPDSVAPACRVLPYYFLQECEYISSCEPVGLCVALGSLFGLLMCDTPFQWTARSEATSEMGYPAWSAGRTCLWKQVWRFVTTSSSRILAGEVETGLLRLYQLAFYFVLPGLRIFFPRGFRGWSNQIERIIH